MSYTKIHYLKILASCFLAVVLSSCGGGGGGNTSSPVPPEPVAPPQPSVGVTKFPDLDWDVEDPEVANVLSVGVNEALDYAFQDNKNTQGVVIVRHGVIIGERYSEDKSQYSLATSWSTGKSFASALIGIALDKG